MGDNRTSDQRPCRHGTPWAEFCKECYDPVPWEGLRSSNQRFCPQTISEADYLELQRMDIATEGSLGDILNRNGHASWTGCPRCSIDDFTHVAGCQLLPTGAADVATPARLGAQSDE